MLNRMLANIKRYWWLGLLLGWFLPAHGAVKVALLGAPDAVQSVREHWQKGAPVWSDPAIADVLLTLGQDAFQQAARWNKPRLALDVPPAVIARARAAHCVCSSVALQPDIVWQLKLIRELLTGNQRVAVLYQAGDNELPRALGRAVPAGLTLDFYALADVETLQARLARILEKDDVLLLVSSPVLFNAESARFILLSSYRQGRPVIGPDASFVKAGSLASVYASNAAVLAAIRRQLDYFAERGNFLPPLFPPPEITVNDHVAHAFDVDVISPTLLLRRLGVEHASSTR